MILTPLYNPARGIMRVAGFMSGTGSNLRKIIEHGKKIEAEKGRAPYEVVVILTDNPDSKALEIGGDYDIDVIVRDIRKFYKDRGKPLSDLSVRTEFDRENVRILRPYRIDVAAYAGYMAIATAPLINAFLGVNVHPADLSVVDENGRRKYTGDNVVRDAILARERQLRASTHIIEQKVDYGRILMISAPLVVELPEDFDFNNAELVKRVAKDHQDRLKEVGDWVIFPRTLEYIAVGRFARDENGMIYFDGEPKPNGVRL